MKNKKIITILAILCAINGLTACSIEGNVQKQHNPIPELDLTPKMASRDKYKGGEYNKKPIIINEPFKVYKFEYEIDDFADDSKSVNEIMDKAELQNYLQWLPFPHDKLDLMDDLKYYVYSIWGTNVRMDNVTAYKDKATLIIDGDKYCDWHPIRSSEYKIVIIPVNNEITQVKNIMSGENAVNANGNKYFYYDNNNKPSSEKDLYTEKVKEALKTAKIDQYGAIMFAEDACLTVNSTDEAAWVAGVLKDEGYVQVDTWRITENNNEENHFYLLEEYHEDRGMFEGDTQIDISLKENNKIEFIYIDDYMISIDKPVIYLYGYNEDVNVKVNLDKKTEFTVTYPEYKSNGWNVTARSDGHLTDKDGKEYKYLYYEASSSNTFDFAEGYCIAREELAGFLEEYLEKLGLNADERNEFIIYWFPQMKQYNYSIISFLTGDEYNKVSELKVIPQPNNITRIYMLWYGSDEYIDIAPQSFKDKTIAPRNGKTVIEWGGTKVK